MFIKNLKELRKENKSTQKDISDVLKITREQYSLYETGKRDLPIEHLVKLAKFYNKSTDEILGIK